MKSSASSSDCVSPTCSVRGIAPGKLAQRSGGGVHLGGPALARELEVGLAERRWEHLKNERGRRGSRANPLSASRSAGQVRAEGKKRPPRAADPLAAELETSGSPCSHGLENLLTAGHP